MRTITTLFLVATLTGCGRETDYTFYPVPGAPVVVDSGISVADYCEDLEASFYAGCIKKHRRHYRNGKHIARCNKESEEYMKQFPVCDGQ